MEPSFRWALVCDASLFAQSFWGQKAKSDGIINAWIEINNYQSGTHK